MFYTRVAICDIDFFNFRNSQVWNIKILNQSEQDQNFAVNFKKHWMQKQKKKGTKCNESELKHIILLWYFVRCHEVLLNFAQFH